jgi:hypothetical protein
MIFSSSLIPSRPCAATMPSSAKCARKALITWVRCRIKRSRARCSINRPCCSNRRSANVAVEGHHLVAKLNQYPRHHRTDPAQQVASRDTPLEVEQVKQLALIAGLSTHHGKPPPLDVSSARNHCSPKITSPFSTKSTLSVTLPADFAASQPEQGLNVLIWINASSSRTVRRNLCYLFALHKKQN